MRSSEQSTEADLDIDVPTSPEDIQALRRLARPSMSWEEYLRFLESFPVSYESLRNRKGPRGEPFSL